MRSRRQDGGPTFTERARRNQIVECALGLIAEIGYAQTSVSKIAERAGLAKSVVLYYFAKKDELVGTLVTEIYLAAAGIMVPALRAESTATGKLHAYIRSHGEFLRTHRPHAMAQLDIWTSYRSASGQRLEEVLRQATAQQSPRVDLAEFDPVTIFELGQRTGEFREFSAPFMAVAVRQAIDGAVLQSSWDPEFDVTAYCEELVTVFDLATKS